MNKAFFSQDELITNQVAVLVSNGQSKHVLNKFFTKNIDASHSCDFVYNCGLALITTRQFNGAIDFLQSSKS